MAGGKTTTGVPACEACCPKGEANDRLSPPRLMCRAAQSTSSLVLICLFSLLSFNADDVGDVGLRELGVDVLELEHLVRHVGFGQSTFMWPGMRPATILCCFEGDR
ncbi:hypothetical protein MES5069_270074 [Mesorhizobium escarrei]|uniref:Uncharacterized protein n=1 Tax=Mesorhizobium escarrei TaxID=666018 RepID=A0ABN8JTS0_9HYPH|nr:hypothetical protein MES5069_270074 [Mesorhizobium escarrei]